MNIEAIIKANNLPFYTIPSCKLSEIFTYYKIGSIITERKVKNKKVFVKLDQKIQLDIFEKVINFRKPFKPYVYAISSTPNDVYAMNITGNIFFHYLKKIPNLTYEWINVSNFEGSYSNSISYDIVIIYNVFSQIEQSRLQKIRDILFSYPESFKIVVVGGCNALQFFDNELKMGLSGCLYVQSKPLNRFKYNVQQVDENNNVLKTYDEQVFDIDFKGLMEELNIKKDKKEL